MKSKCEGCKYNEITYGKRFWKCTHPIPCEDRKISEYGCEYGEQLKKVVRFAKKRYVQFLHIPLNMVLLKLM